jgi:cytochrome c oxidase assembly protein subunit 11
MRDPNRKLALKLGLLVALMLGAAFAAVPFYRLFCQLTGFGGIAQRAEALPPATAALDRTMTIAFNADVAPDLPWEFVPATRSLNFRVGEPITTHYTVTNRSDRTLVGTATHNVQPELLAPWFNKVECFCYQEQVLKPGESKDMPLTFFVDPDIVKDPDMKGVEAVALSYTFFLAQDQSRAKLAP